MGLYGSRGLSRETVTAQQGGMPLRTRVEVSKALKELPSQCRAAMGERIADCSRNDLYRKLQGYHVFVEF